MANPSFRKKGKIVKDEKAATTEELQSNWGQLLPNDFIIDEILCILPIKCIARCKCVCKSWRRIIDEDRRFIEKVMYHGKPYKLNLDIYGEQRPLFTFEGLILEKCIATCTYRIRNHISNQVLDLPSLEAIYFVRIYMGYASSTNEYKVWHLYMKGSVIGMEILTAGVDQRWRPIQTPYTLDISKNDKTIYYIIDGISYIMMYCRSSEKDEDQTNKIIGFRCEDESFIEFAIPEGLIGLLRGSSNIASLKVLKWDKKLSVCCMVEDQFHIWVLMENNFKKPKWDRRRITLSSEFRIKTDPVLVNKIFVSDVSGNLATLYMRFRYKVVIYDIQSRKIVARGDKSSEVRPSLVSFRGMKRGD